MKILFNKFVGRLLDLICKKNESQETAGLPCGIFPPGHFYSTIPSGDDIKKYSDKAHEKKISDSIDINSKEQISLIKHFSKIYGNVPFNKIKKDGSRFYYENPNFSYGDANSLYYMIRHLKPNRIIEIGSGYSSCVTLDVNEKYFNNKIQCTFIEPYPELLYKLMKRGDRKRNRVVNKNIQEIDLSMFKKLSKNDILFVDSTHVSKYGSDVNYIFFEILPLLKKGVHVHFHDIFYPFEYPKGWLDQGIYWNENYILHAFLSYNRTFRIKLFNNYLYECKREILFKHLPDYANNGGGSIWLEKV